MNKHYLNKHYLYRASISFISVLLLSGCGSLANDVKKIASDVVPGFEYNSTDIDSISLKSDPDSNSNLPTALDIIFIYEDKTYEALSALSGPDWFAQKQALLLVHGQNIYITGLEVVPQSPEKQIPLPDKYYNASYVLLFANYIAPDGQYQADITQYSELLITLKNKGYTLEELDP